MVVNLKSYSFLCLLKCRELYFSIKDAMEKAVTRLDNKVNNSETPSGSDLGGEFAISDINTEETGVLQISMDGIGLAFENKKVRLTYIFNTIRRSILELIYLNIIQY